MERSRGRRHILTVILQETTGMNPRYFAEQYLFKPLGISAGRWMTDPAGIPYGAGGFELTPRTWPSWDTSISGRASGMGSRSSPPSGWRTPRGPDAHVDVNAHFGYGYHWFTVPRNGGLCSIGGWRTDRPRGPGVRPGHRHDGENRGEPLRAVRQIHPASRAEITVESADACGVTQVNQECA